jgi:uncharacterized protein YwgA
MERLQKAAVLTRLLDRLRAKESWGGETHIQKAAYFLQTLLGVPLGFEFVLYRYGPFSFDLRDELTALRADDLLGLEIRAPYGPRLITTEQGRTWQGRFPKTLGRYGDAIDFVAQTLGDEDVAGLEKVATALYVTTNWDESDVEARAARLRELKPHIPLDAAREAVRRLDRITAAAASVPRG